MAYGVRNLHEHNANESGIRGAVAANSLSVVQGTPLSHGTSGMTITAAAGNIHGVCVSKKTFAADNFTVAKEEVLFHPEPEQQNTYLIPITGGTITLADQGSFYDILVDATTGYKTAVDGASESASTGQLQMVKFISSSVGIFKVVNA